ncbi:lytic polysaccharide monooxygenase auxiliary activity family 9 protein [Nonomuraea gerenzanensis]|uniref:Cellulose-binding, family II, bacterial type:Fibronectin, type III n=1 Tax=Nonomuraea gerenzanensis TaxID=93944 RepID=A0A1M4DXT6_9ACTN|nr:lytic polysaccharide monooxygenase [Nonomuraea gerenzanensis]UBU13705.1 lytic polysaccharide monooxygenase [Nonomuraea gerenzanensis]SBO91373.1 Cellulose-binding, family II, bacterial type:Fibronectin, type III precursor [Nonomuraea gerenzanensis]
MWSYRTGIVMVALLSPAVLVAGGPAGAHGALEDPLSRAAACGAEGPRQAANSAACRAAVRVSGGVLPRSWDDLRVANVAGRDRQVVPDGKLCSGGLAAFKGLDLARADWPATTVRAGARFAFRYRGTIPHRGVFRLYVTKKGYDPARPLRWADLERKPFLTVTDPELKDGSYTFSGRLPVRSGRHLIYAVWQNSDTPDTYYSCSDVVFQRAAKGAAAAAAPPARPAAAGRVARVGERDASWLVGGSVVLAGCAGATGLLISRRRHRWQR